MFKERLLVYKLDNGGNGSCNGGQFCEDDPYRMRAGAIGCGNLGNGIGSNVHEPDSDEMFIYDTDVPDSLNVTRNRVGNVVDNSNMIFWRRD